MKYFIIRCRCDYRDDIEITDTNRQVLSVPISGLRLKMNSGICYKQDNTVSTKILLMLRYSAYLIPQEEWWGGSLTLKQLVYLEAINMRIRGFRDREDLRMCLHLYWRVPHTDYQYHHSCCWRRQNMTICPTLSGDWQ